MCRRSSYPSARAKPRIASVRKPDNNENDTVMNELPGQVLDYLSYKNKRRAMEWTERLWRQHLEGAPQDFRPDEDRQRYGDLAARLEASRLLAKKLHSRRARYAPVFSALAADGR